NSFDARATTHERTGSPFARGGSLSAGTRWTLLCRAPRPRRLHRRDRPAAPPAARDRVPLRRGPHRRRHPGRVDARSRSPARAAESEGRGRSAAPERRGRRAAPERRGQSAATEVRGVIAPHIDFHGGGSAYAWAYRELAERSAADLFVIFGTCHAGMEHPFA